MVTMLCGEETVLSRIGAGLVSGAWALSLFVATFGVLLNVSVVWGSGTIYIRADGSIDPPTAPIQRNGDIYIFTSNIYETVEVQRDNITVNGNGYTLQGGTDYGFFLSERNNVTIKNTRITGFSTGISLYSSSNNTISNNTLTSNRWFGISIQGASIILPSSNNMIINNTVTEVECGIQFHGGGEYYNRIENNKIYMNAIGIQLSENTRYTVFLGNSLSYNDYGFMIMERPEGEENYGNKIFHNNFVENTHQAVDNGTGNIWDDGYPSGGNYWSDYTGQDANGDGKGDTPYVIDANNQDRYPLMSPWGVAVSVPSGVQVNVKAGDWMKLDYAITGAPTGTPLPQWIKIEFLSVEGATANIRVTMHMSDGTEPSQTMTVDVAVGGGTFQGLSGFVIPANYTTGDSVYISGYGNVTIAGETTRTYAGASRTVVHASFSQYGTQLTYYWDKQTGVMVEASTVSGSITGIAKATETNMWQAQPSGLAFDQTYLYVLVAVVIAIAVGSIALLMRRKKKPSEVATPTAPTLQTTFST